MIIPKKCIHKIRVYGENSFDDKLVVVDENLNFHKIANPNALNFISIAIVPSSFFLSPPCKHLQTPFQPKKILVILPQMTTIVPRHS